MDLIELGKRLRIVREIRGYDQDEEAVILNCDSTKISDIERGEQSPKYVDLLILARALHISLDVLGAPGEFDLKACLLPTWPGKDETLKPKAKERAALKAKRKKRKGS